VSRSFFNTSLISYLLLYSFSDFPLVTVFSLTLVSLPPTSFFLITVSVDFYASIYMEITFIFIAFHHAFPVHDLEAAKHFYGTILGCAEGRSSTKWQDYSLYGHQIVAHWVGSDYRCQDYFNPVDGDEVPVPHTGLALTEEEFHALAVRVRDAGITFIIEPHLRFKGMPGEQWTMFFKDPSGNNLEFKAMTTLENLFAKYNVADN
jgi:extradiol dioxygenase family protein